MIVPAKVRRGTADTRYLHVARHPVFGRVVPGLLLSGLGDGISLVALPWLALELAHGRRAALLVGAALACYQLPGALAVPVLSRALRRVPAHRLAAADGLLRAVGLGLVPLLAALHALTGVGLLVAVSASSLLCAWGIAGRFSFVAEAVDTRQRLTANTIALTGRQATSLLGAMVAGALVTHVGAALAVGLDAITFAVLGLGYLAAHPAPRNRERPASCGPAKGPPGSAADSRTPASASPAVPGARPGFVALRRTTPLRLLVGLSLLLSLCTGAARVAVPLLVVFTWHGQAHLLGFFWAVAGLGAVLGGLLTRHAGRRPAWPMMTGMVAGGGVLLALVALSPRPLMAVALFGLATAVTAPMVPMAFSMTQLLSPPGELRATLAARSSLLLLSSPLGNVAGGLMTGMFSPAVAMAGAAAAMTMGAAGYWLLGRHVATLRQPPAATGRVMAVLGAESASARTT